MVDLLGRFPDEEQATCDQDQVAPGQALAEDFQYRFRQLDNDGNGAKQPDPHDQCEADADPSGPFAVGLGELVRQDRYENEVVDARERLPWRSVSAMRPRRQGLPPVA